MAKLGTPVFVYGATGHTGRFVIAELRRRGVPVVAGGRDPERLERLLQQWPQLITRAAAVDDADALDRALAGTGAVINCGGPFAVTAAPLVDAALRAGVPYIDVAAEIEANVSIFADYAEAASSAGVLVVPAMAFYGGLSDLMVTAAMGEWTTADSIDIAYGLSSWRPTEGTRAAGRVSHRRRSGRSVRFADGALQYSDETTTERDWSFPAPFGTRRVLAGFTMTDVVTIPSHLEVDAVTTHMSVEAARDLASPDPSGPRPVDEDGRSDQRFIVDVVVRSGDRERRTTAHGQDIYAVTAPLVAEAVVRILDGRARGAGVRSAGAAFDAGDFLAALAPGITTRIG